MNIEKIFTLSIQFFKATIRVILPFIVFYSIFVILIDYFFGISQKSTDYFIVLPNNIYDILSLLITYFINTLYSVLIIKFIFDRKNNEKIKFNLSLIFTFLIRIMGLQIIIFIFPILLISFIPGLEIFVLAIPILYFISFFAQYIIINQYKNIIESIMTSYMIIKNNLNKFITLIFINIFFMIIIIYFSILIYQFSFILNSILLNVQLYFIAIFNITFYHMITNFIDE